MKNILSILLGLLLTSCGVGFQYTALNHAGHIDGIYSSNDIVLEVPSNIQIDTLNEFQLRRKLRTDFQFRYDFAQYAMNQPYSWYFQNRRFNRYSYWRPYTSFDFYFNSTQYWTDWAFNYPFQSNYYGWNRPYWGWNNSWWNNWGWRNQMNNYAWMYKNRPNTVRINGRRGFSNIQNRVIANNTNRTRIVTTKPRIVPSTNNRTIRVNTPRINYNTKPRINNINNINNNSRPRINNNPRPSTTIRTTPSNPTRSSNNTTVRSNSRRKN